MSTQEELDKDFQVYLRYDPEIKCRIEMVIDFKNPFTIDVVEAIFIDVLRQIAKDTDVSGEKPKDPGP